MNDDTIPVFAPPRHDPAFATTSTRVPVWESFDDGKNFRLQGTRDWVVSQSLTGNWLVFNGGDALDAYPTRHQAMARAEKLAGAAS